MTTQKLFSTLFLLLSFNAIIAQEKPKYDEELAKSLNADQRGMKQYVLCILKTGKNTTATKEEQTKLFEGHMANITALAKEGKLVVAGPFIKNDKNYRGVFVFNVDTIEEAEKLVVTDPAVKAGIFEADLTVWYCTAALQEVTKIHEKIVKPKS